MDARLNFRAAVIVSLLSASGWVMAEEASSSSARGSAAQSVSLRVTIRPHLSLGRALIPAGQPAASPSSLWLEQGEQWQRSTNPPAQGTATALLIASP